MPESALTGTVPPYYVQLLFDYLDARGESARSILQESLPEPDAACGVPVNEWARLLSRAARHLKDPMLGLNLGQTITPRHLDVLGHLTLACDHLAGALLRLERYQRLIWDYAPMRQRTVSDYVELSWDPSYRQPGPLVDETGITALIAFCRQMVDQNSGVDGGASPSPRLVCFTNPAPTDIKPYEQYFGCPVLFDQPETRVQVSLSTMLLPLRGADADLATLMEHQAENRLAALPEAIPLVRAVRRSIARRLHEGEPTIEQIAEARQVATRTLQRRLRESGSSFRDQLADVRYQLARNYLRDRRLSIANVAQLLGYSEQSAFSRSFAQWSGKNPHSWRAVLTRR